MPPPFEENRRVRILIVDDDPSQRSLVHSFLKVQGFQTTPVASGEEALRQLAEQRFDMMISDVRMPGISGLETMRRARAAHATMPILLVTAYADIREAVGAMRDGALNYLSKPIDLDELLASVRQAIGLTRTAPLQFQDHDKPLPVALIAQSPLMQSVLRDASLVAPADTRVLITGESGVGKELVAELIHAWSSRARAPFVKVSCAAIPEAQLERELFGEGTGQGVQRAGAFEQATNGTVLLDEIGELSPAIQAKLLRITQDGQFHRIGSSDELATHARILASTNRDIDESVKQGAFREDLFYRLNVVELNIPPLRERREDILPLATHFLNGITNGRAKLSASASAVLESYAWPGNARELRNAMERAALLSRGELILPDHLPARVRGSGESSALSGFDTNDAQRLEEMEEQAILNALRKHDFNRTDTARALGISRRGLLYKLQHLRERGHKVDAE